MTENMKQNQNTAQASWPPPQRPAEARPGRQRRSLQARLGMSLPAVVLLAAVAAVRVPLHDLGLVDEGTLLAWLLAVVPLALWVAVALWRRVPNPLITLTLVGLTYGVMLATIHLVLWDLAFAGAPPQLGGSLAGALSPVAESLLLRAAVVPSSLVVGTVLGALAGAVAWAIRRVSSR